MLPLFRMVKSKYNYFGAIYDTCSPTQTARVTRGTVLWVKKVPENRPRGSKLPGEPSLRAQKVPENRPRGLAFPWVGFIFAIHSKREML